jgi:hypothetical protein
MLVEHIVRRERVRAYDLDAAVAGHEPARPQRSRDGL